MKRRSLKRRILAGLILISLLPFTRLQAQENPIKLYGEIYTDNRFRLNDGQWSWNENRLDLQLEKKFTDKAKFHSEVWLRSFGFPLITNTDQLFNKDLTSPYNIDIREAYVELYGFLSKNLDVKIGRQRIAWGTADRLNPTDNLNSYDLEDIWDFGRHNGSDGIHATYYIKDFYIEGDYIALFRPATLPLGDWSSALTTSIPVPAGFYLANFSDSLAMPALNLRGNSTYGLKFGGYLSSIDFSLSYVYGRTQLPLPYHNVIAPVGMEGALDIRSYMSYPRQHIIGADMATSVKGIGLWAEAATFIPENKVIASNDLSSFGLPPTDTLLLDNTPYIKFVIGGDYSFSDGSYLNFQYLHGFMNEMGSKNLNDYFVLNYEKKFFEDKLNIKPLTMAFVVSDWKDIPGNYAWIYMPSIDYMPNLNTTISLGLRLIRGEGESAFAMLKDKDEFVFSLKFSF